jgi:subtilase family serine protease
MRSVFATRNVFERCLGAVVVLGMMAAPVSGQASGLATRHVRQAVASGQAMAVGRLPAQQTLKLNIALPLRNEAELDALLERQYDPASADYRRWLSVEQFTDRFGPSQQDYQAVLDFARAHGLQVSGTYRNRMVVNVTGAVEDIESAFHVTLGQYQHPTENRTFYAPDREPAADLPVALWHVTGLDNFSVPHPASLVQAAAPAAGEAAPRRHSGSGPNGEFLGSDFRTAYYGGSALTGAGQSVGLLEFAGYDEADVTRYFAQVGQPQGVQVVGVSTDGSSLSCDRYCDDTEQVLDIEVAISMAPGMDQVRVYVSDSSDVAIFNSMAAENVAKSLGCSWGWSPADPASDDPIFKEMAAQGQNMFVASGDDGAYLKQSPEVYPADDAYITSVGGTTLGTNGPGGAWKWETAWNGSGGGASPNKIAIPSWQRTAGVITAANRGSRLYRSSPDVAAEGNTDNFICADRTCAGGWGGSSFSAPRWAGYLALVDERAVELGLATPGFINPALYAIGLSADGSKDFHDIVSGTNGTYRCQAGYDLVTGWGTPSAALIDALAH